MSYTEALKAEFKDAIQDSFSKGNQEVVVISADSLRPILQFLKNDQGFDILLDVIAIDWHGKKPQRFEIDYPLYNLEKKARILIKTFLPDDEKPAVDSVADIFSSADWAERECYDMMGIHFTGHPNLKRLLMWENFIGHPLRKDYPLNRRQPIPLQEDIV